MKDLINKSTNEVATGSRLVQETRAVLAAISQHVEMIATVSSDQSAAFRSQRLRQLDGPDDPAERREVEETTQANRLLAGKADTLMTLVEPFRL